MNTSAPWQGDIPIGDWIDRLIPAPIRPYLRLMRLDRPIGSWLLLFPCWWSVALAGDRWPDLRLMALFGIGAVIMRGAGCTFNDIIDRDLDAQVARTARRPIPSGAVTPFQAALFMLAQLVVGLAILLQFNHAAILTGICSLFLVFTYPFMKRFTFWPQAWLGLAFNWGALMGWVAVHGHLAMPAFILYAAGLMWTLGYDTIYALQDKKDDPNAGIKSTALQFGAYAPYWVAFFYVLTMLLLGLAGHSAGLSWLFYPLLLAPAAQLVWQVTTLRMEEPRDCLAKFRSNRWFGWLVLAAIIVGRAL